MAIFKFFCSLTIDDRHVVHLCRRALKTEFLVMKKIYFWSELKVQLMRVFRKVLMYFCSLVLMNRW
jgi:hypothetical protein